MQTTSRLPHDASNLLDVTQYYDTRARQLKHAGYWLKAPPVELKVRGLIAYRAEFHNARGDDYSSFYLPPESRGKGLFKELVKSSRCRLSISCALRGLNRHYNDRLSHLCSWHCVTCTLNDRCRCLPVVVYAKASGDLVLQV